MRLKVGACAAFALLASACRSIPPGAAVGPGCVQVSIQELSAEPNRYEGRHVCVSGFFGWIVPYGETRFELFATREQAESGLADTLLGLGIRWDVMLQAELARHSAEFVRVEGIFEHNPRCWPAEGRDEPDYNCFPPQRMRIRYAFVRFPDGSTYRHPDFDARVRR